MIEIRDLAGDGDHYAARVISPSFAGMSRVRQHQAVYAALKEKWGPTCMPCSLKLLSHREIINERY